MKRAIFDEIELILKRNEKNSKVFLKTFAHQLFEIKSQILNVKGEIAKSLTSFCKICFCQTRSIYVIR